VRLRLAVLAVVAVAFSSFIVGRFLADNDFNPTTTIKFGEVFTEQNQYAEDLLGEIVLAPKAGHDGKFFFSQAMDPFYLEPSVHAIYLDRQTYRAQRMAYPTLASLGGLLSPRATAWGLIVVNVLAMAIGTVYTGLLANKMGLSVMFGLAFLLNPGMIVDLSIDGGGVLALAGVMAGVYYAVSERWLAAAVALSIAALSRETMLISVVGLSLFAFYKKRRIPWQYALPFVSVAAWWLYVHWRLEDGLAQDTQALGAPFVGFAHAFQGWLATPDSAVDLLVGCVLLAVALMVVVRSVRTPVVLGWAVAGFALLGIMLSEPVWERWFDSSRALAPVLTGYILLVPAISKSEKGDQGLPGGRAVADSVRG
jgi:hypothetical protein